MEVTSAADGVHCCDPDGSLIGKLGFPEFVSNLAFGGLGLKRLFITGTTSLYAVYFTANGVLRDEWTAPGLNRPGQPMTMLQPVRL